MMTLHQGHDPIAIAIAFVLIMILSSTLMFALLWYKFKIWAGTRLGRTALMVNYAVIGLAVIEILSELNIHTSDWARLATWIAMLIAVIIRTVAMLEGRSEMCPKGKDEHGDAI